MKLFDECCALGLEHEFRERARWIAEPGPNQSTMKKDGRDSIQRLIQRSRDGEPAPSSPAGRDRFNRARTHTRARARTHRHTRTHTHTRTHAHTLHHNTPTRHHTHALHEHTNMCTICAGISRTTRCRVCVLGRSAYVCVRLLLMFVSSKHHHNPLHPVLIKYSFVGHGKTLVGWLLFRASLSQPAALSQQILFYNIFTFSTAPIDVLQVLRSPVWLHQEFRKWCASALWSRLPDDLIHHIIELHKKQITGKHPVELRQNQNVNGWCGLGELFSGRGGRGLYGRGRGGRGVYLLSSGLHRRGRGGRGFYKVSS